MRAFLPIFLKYLITIGGTSSSVQLQLQDGVLISSGKIEKLLGNNGLGVIRKIFGVVLLAIAVKLFAANVKGLFI